MTLGTWLFTKMRGERVGTDAEGNQYYQDKRMIAGRRYARALEVGYGAGAVLLAIAASVDHLHGIDLDADPAPVRAWLASHGRTARLIQGSVYELPYETAEFDLAISFSVFEHLHQYERGLVEVARVLNTSQPGVSRQIRELEDELGVDLSVRSGKRLTALTEMGEHLAAELVADVEGCDAHWISWWKAGGGRARARRRARARPRRVARIRRLARAAA